MQAYPRRVPIACMECRRQKVKCQHMKEDEICVRCKAKNLDCRYVPVSKDEADSQPSPTSICSPQPTAPAYALPDPTHFLPAPQPEEVPCGKWVTQGGQPDLRSQSGPFNFQHESETVATGHAGHSYAEYNITDRLPHLPQDDISTSNLPYHIQPNHTLQYTDSNHPMLQPTADSRSAYAHVHSLTMDAAPQNVASVTDTLDPSIMPPVDSHHGLNGFHSPRRSMQLQIPSMPANAHQLPPTPSYPVSAYRAEPTLLSDSLESAQRSPIRTPDSIQGSPQHTDMAPYFHLESGWSTSMHPQDRVPRSQPTNTTNDASYYESYTAPGPSRYTLSNGGVSMHGDGLEFD